MFCPTNRDEGMFAVIRTASVIHYSTENAATDRLTWMCGDSMSGNDAMLRICVLLSLSLLVANGCKSGNVIRLRDRTAQKYEPAIPEAAIAASDSPDTNDSGEEVVTAPSLHQSSIQQVSSKTTVTDETLAADENADTTQQHAEAGLTLSESISLALSQNPDLIALRQTEDVSVGALGVAQTYPFNPFVQVQATPYQHSQNGQAGTTYHYVLLMQTIQLAHQQQYREQGAASALNSTRWNIHQAELQALATTERLYFTALYPRGIMQLAEANDQNNRQVLRILENQLQAGEATAANFEIVGIDRQSTLQQLQLASANYQAAVRDLARQIGVSPQNLQSPSGSLESIEWRIPGGTNGMSVAAMNSDLNIAAADARGGVVSWASSRPDVMAARSDIDVARSNLNLAAASKTPDLQIGPYYQTTADGTNFVGFRGQVDLPIINTGEPLERQRCAEHRQRYIVWQQAQRRAELEAQAAFDRYHTALMAVTSDSNTVAENMPAALEGLERQFMEGEVDVTRVVQARSSIITSQRARLDLLNEVAQSAAALTAATGIPVENVITVEIE